MKGNCDNLIADSGFLVSLFVTREQHYEAVKVFFAALTTAFTNGRGCGGGSQILFAWPPTAIFLYAVAAGALPLPSQEASSHKRIRELCAKYDDMAPDYADMALLELAERTDLRAVLTLEDHDFSIYCIKGRKSFDLVRWF